MFAMYAWNSGASQANILSDIIALLTGETDKNTLSAACNKAGSAIYSGYAAAGWTVHDAAAGTNRRVISAPCADGVFSKFIIVDTNTTGTLSFGGCESWDSSTKAGTNYLGGNILPLSFSLGFNSGAGILLLYATVYGIYACFRTTGAYGNFGIICAEWQRDSLIMDVAKGYPCWGGCTTAPAFATYGSIGVPRKKNHTAAGDSTGAASAAILHMLNPVAVLNGLGVLSTSSRDSDNSTYFDVSSGMYWAFGSSINSATPHGWAGKSRIQFLRLNAGDNLDEIVIDSVTYIRMCALAGSIGVLWAPRG